MGNIQKLISKAQQCLKQDDKNIPFSYFQQQQKLNYTKEMGKKCLQHMLDTLDFLNNSSLKKLFRYLHPALKYIMYCENPVEQSGQQNHEVSIDEQNFFIIHQEQLLGSANNVLQLYCQFLSKVVPANISYFHFMREKDFYIHYSTLKYILEAGFAGFKSQKINESINVFTKLKIENRISYIKLISHWLYDMIKYRCSAIYLNSSTIDQLIIVNSIVLCGLISLQKQNIIDLIRQRQIQKAKTSADLQILEIYQHCLYSLTYVLTELHPNKLTSGKRGNGYIQISLIGIISLVNSMWRNQGKNPQNINIQEMKKKVMYGPSYWYASEIGFIKNPVLENLIFQFLVDIIDKNQNVEKIVEQLFRRKQSQQQNKEKNIEEKYEKFQDQVELQTSNPRTQSEVDRKISSNQVSPLANQLYQFQANLMKLPPKFENKYQIPVAPINNMTHMLLYHAIIVLLQHFFDVLNLEKLLNLMEKQIKKLEVSSFIRPLILLTLELIEEKLEQKDTLASSSIKQTAKYDFRDVQTKIPESLIEYKRNNSIDYSIDEYIIPFRVVAKSCSVHITKTVQSRLHKYDIQVDQSDSEIWRRILKYNRSAMKNYS